MILSEEQRILRDTIRDWAQSHLLPGAAERDRLSAFPTEQLSALAELGLFGMTIPEEWEGAGADMLSLAIALEEIAAADGACSTILSVNKLGRLRSPTPLWQHGSKATLPERASLR